MRPRAAFFACSNSSGGTRNTLAPSLMAASVLWSTPPTGPTGTPAPDERATRAVGAAADDRAVDPCVVPPGQVGGSNVDDGTLPRTGSDNLGLVALGLALLASGGAVVYAVHRAQRPAAS